MKRTILIQRDHLTSELPNSIRQSRHVLVMTDGMCPFHLEERLPPLLEVHGSRCIVHDPSTEKMKFDLSLTEKSEPLILPTGIWLEMVGAYIILEYRSIPMLIRMTDSIVENPIGCLSIILC